jgi:hypothetical protein
MKISEVRGICWKDTLITSRVMLRRCAIRYWTGAIDLDQHPGQEAVVRLPRREILPLHLGGNVKNQLLQNRQCQWRRPRQQGKCESRITTKPFSEA